MVFSLSWLSLEFFSVMIFIVSFTDIQKGVHCVLQIDIHKKEKKGKQIIK